MCEVWLEIHDAETTPDSDPPRIAWRWQVHARSCSAEVSFVSPLTPATESLIRGYVREFRSWRPSDRDRALTAERTLLNLGRSLGSALIDSSYQLLTLCELIEREGVDALHVAIVSSRARVVELPWEMLILPDSPYVLSAASAAFLRAPAGVKPFELEARVLGLGAEQPLRYLRIDTAIQPWRARTRLSMTWAQLGWQGALSYRLTHSLSSPEPVGDRTRTARHIVHWAGSVTLRDGAPHAMLEDPAGDMHALSASDFVALVQALGPALLILEPSAGSAPADEIALAALQAGLDNVLILAEPGEHGWPNDWADHLLESIRGGLGLRRAVVETRKRMQRALLEARQGEVEQLHAPQQWHGLRHYSRRDVVFYAKPPVLVAFDSTETHAELRRTLFGFDSACLPPQAPDLGDCAVLALLRGLRGQRAALVHAVRGGGVTHAVHRLALFARANGDVARTYYWDFAREAYSVRDLLEMVAGARGEADPNQVREAETLQPLRERPELFVFDNVDALESEPSSGEPSRLGELLQLVARIAHAGGLCVLATHRPLAAQTTLSGVSTLTLPALSEAECLAVVEATSRHALALGARLLPLLDQLHGNPLLLRRVVGQCTAEDLAELLAEATASFGSSADLAEHSAVDLFHAHRWQQLSPAWQRLILAWLPLQGLYLQILMIAIDRPGGDLSEDGRALWTALGAPEGASCAAAIAQLQAAGFVVASGAGSSVDRAALPFLRARRTPELQASLGSQLAKLLCGGLVRILERRGQAAAEALAGHFLAHRELLFEQIEIAARARAYVLAARAFLSMHALASQANLGAEAGDRARSFLEAAGREMCTAQDPDVGAAWLSIALRARARHAAKPGAVIEAGLGHWAEQLACGALTATTAPPGLLALAVAFLEQTYDQLGDLAGYRTVARAACDHYRAIEDRRALVPQLRALAAAEHTLGDAPERDRIEDELVHGLDYGSLQGGTELRRQTLAALAGMRLRRADDPGAEALIERIEREAEHADGDVLALTLRGELALSRSQWEHAASFFCQLWSAAVSGRQGFDIDAVARRLAQVEQQLGAERFARVYEQHAGATPTPAALGVIVAESLSPRSARTSTGSLDDPP